MKYSILFGVVAATFVGLLVHRDAISRKLTHPFIYSLSTGLVSGVGAALSYWYASDLVFGIHRAAFGQNYITNPFEVPFTYLFLSVVAAALTVSIYRFSTSLTSQSRASS